MLHTATCVWIWISLTGSLAELFASWKEDVAAAVHEGQTAQVDALLSRSDELYANSFYFMCTTMSTIGYGDRSGSNAVERIFLMFVIFSGIAMFTIISQ